jgi:hypothetical protein
MAERLGPAFNRLFSASVISNLSDGLLAVAAPLLAISLISLSAGSFIYNVGNQTSAGDHAEPRATA